MCIANVPGVAQRMPTNQTHSNQPSPKPAPTIVPCGEIITDRSSIGLLRNNIRALHDQHDGYVKASPRLMKVIEAVMKTEHGISTTSFIQDAFGAIGHLSKGDLTALPKGHIAEPIAGMNPEYYLKLYDNLGALAVQVGFAPGITKELADARDMLKRALATSTKGDPTSYFRSLVKVDAPIKLPKPEEIKKPINKKPALPSQKPTGSQSEQSTSISLASADAISSDEIFTPLINKNLGELREAHKKFGFRDFNHSSCRMVATIAGLSIKAIENLRKRIDENSDLSSRDVKSSAATRLEDIRAEISAVRDTINRAAKADKNQMPELNNLLAAMSGLADDLSSPSAAYFSGEALHVTNSFLLTAIKALTK